MANYKLSQDYWETSGVFDVEQNKTQRQINNETTPVTEAKTTTGDVVTFNGGGDGVPVKSLVVNIEPVQSGSGDPSPTNIRPITGWTGCTVYKRGEDFNNELTYKASTYIDENGNEVSSTYMTMEETYIPCKAGDKFFITTVPKNDGRRARVHEYNSAKQWIRQVVVSEQLPVNKQSYLSWAASSDAAYVRFSVPNYNSIAVSYGEIIPYTFPVAAGTVYGGTLDVTNGVLTITHKCRKLSDFSWTYYSNSGAFRMAKSGDWAEILRITGGQIDAKCTAYKTTNYADLADKCITIGDPRSSTYNAFIQDDDYNGNSTTWLAAVGDEMFTYQLVESAYITYQLTPTEVKTLLGQNNIWADCGDVDVEYGAYLTVVENQLGEKTPKVAIAPIEKTTTASKAYSVNELFFMGDKLYIATAAIASGATFTVGTNCDETTVGAILTSLLNA